MCGFPGSDLDFPGGYIRDSFLGEVSLFPIQFPDVWTPVFGYVTVTFLFKASGFHD